MFKYVFIIHTYYNKFSFIYIYIFILYMLYYLCFIIYIF